MKKLLKNIIPLVPISVIPGIKAVHDEESFEYKACASLISNFNKEYDPTIIKVTRAWNILGGKVVRFVYITQVYFKASVTMHITNQERYIITEDFDFNPDVVNEGFKDLEKSNPSAFQDIIKNTSPAKGFFGSSMYYDSISKDGVHFKKNTIIEMPGDGQNDKRNNIIRLIMTKADCHELAPEGLYEINKILHDYKEACGWLL